MSFGCHTAELFPLGKISSASTFTTRRRCWRGGAGGVTPHECLSAHSCTVRSTRKYWGLGNSLQQPCSVLAQQMERGGLWDWEIGTRKHRDYYCLSLTHTRTRSRATWTKSTSFARAGLVLCMLAKSARRWNATAGEKLRDPARAIWRATARGRGGKRAHERFGGCTWCRWWHQLGRRLPLLGVTERQYTYIGTSLIGSSASFAACLAFIVPDFTTRQSYDWL